MSLTMNNTNKLITKVSDPTLEAVHYIMNGKGIIKESDFLRMSITAFIYSPDNIHLVPKELLKKLSGK